MSGPLTIAIPYYTGLEYLRLAVNSVLTQNDPNWCLVVLDDAGPESAADLVCSYADSRIKYVRNARNLGMGGNWNRCIAAAGTELVTLLHADDELRPGYVARMRAAALEYPTAAVLFCGADIIGPDGRLIFSLPDRVKRVLMPRSRRPVVLRGRAGVERLAGGNFLTCPTACYRVTRLVDRRFREDLRFVLDLDLYTRLLFDGEELIVVPDQEYAYRRHAANATETLTGSLVRFKEEWDCYDRIAATARVRGWGRAAGRASRRVMLRLNLLYRVGHDIRNRSLRQAMRKLAFLS